MQGQDGLFAAVYLFKLCRAILVGFRRQQQFNGVYEDSFVGMLDSEIEKAEVLPVLHLGMADQIFDIDIDGKKVYHDDLTGQALDPRLVREARQKELDFLEA